MVLLYGITNSTKILPFASKKLLESGYDFTTLLIFLG